MGNCLNIGSSTLNAPIYRKETSECNGIVLHLDEILNIPDMDDSLRKDDVSDIFLTLQIFNNINEPFE